MARSSYSSRSRLYRHADRQSKKRLYLSIFGIVVVLGFLFLLAIPLLIRFSVFVGDIKGIEEIADDKKSAFISAPRLSPLPSATNSATLVVEGIGTKETEIELFIDEDLVKKLVTDEDGTFKVASVKLREGENVIRARTKEDGQRSDFSNEVIVIYDNEAPKVNIESPGENETFSKDQKMVQVRGETEGGSRVTINGFWATVDGNGNFSYNLPVREGENTIKVEVEDEAGNKTTVERKINLF